MYKNQIEEYYPNGLSEYLHRYDNRIPPIFEKLYKVPIEDLFLDEATSNGYTLKAMSAGLWACFKAENFEDNLLRVINEGGDADTNACAAGSILGAKFGYKSIPEKYIDGLIYKDMLEKNLTDILSASTKAKIR